MSKLTISPLRIMLGVGATLLVTLLSLYLSFQRFSNLNTANAWNIHTYQVLLETNHMQRDLLSIQTAARGFLQTGDEEFLEPLQTGRAGFKEHYINALKLTQDKPEQQKRLKLLERQYGIFMRGHIDPLVQMRRSTPDMMKAMQLAMPGVQKRKVVMDAMLQTLSQMEKTENNFLVERMQHERTQQNLAQFTLLLNGLLAVLLAVGLSAFLSTKSQRLNQVNTYLSEQIKRREKAERDAKALNDHNEMILRATNEGIAGLNQAGRITFFNPAAESITGWPIAQALGKSLHDLLHCRRADGMPYPAEDSPILWTLRDGTQHHASDEVFWHKDGHAIPVEFTAVPLMTEDEDGTGAKQTGAVVMFQDIAQKKKDAASLQEMAAIVKYSDDAIISFDLRGVIRNWNRGATDLYGYTEWESIGQYMDRLLPPDSPDELPRLLRKLENGEHIERYETTHVRKDGTKAEVILSLSPTKDENGQVTGAASISRETYRSRMQRMADNTSSSSANGHSAPV